ncbi:MAG: molybdate ABC transporter substrate-binding protein [Terriglobales bacterium]
MKEIRALLLIVCFCSFSRAAIADEVTVAAASDLSFAFKEIATGFEKQTGHTLRVSTGSSGNFFAQIRGGAPFDVFFSADAEYPRKLEAEGLAQEGSLYVYAIGRIVIWVPRGSRDLSKEDLTKEGMRALLKPGVRKIAIANPRHAPYGRAAVAALKHFGIYEQVEARLVFGENVAQAAQFVESGNAQAGIIALSLASAPQMKDRGEQWLIPEEAHPRLEQAAVVMRTARSPQAARALLDYLRGPEGQALLKRYGFQLPVKQP